MPQVIGTPASTARQNNTNRVMQSLQYFDQARQAKAASLFDEIQKTVDSTYDGNWSMFLSRPENQAMWNQYRSLRQGILPSLGLTPGIQSGHQMAQSAPISNEDRWQQTQSELNKGTLGWSDPVEVEKTLVDSGVNPTVANQVAQSYAATVTPTQPQQPATPTTTAPTPTPTPAPQAAPSTQMPISTLGGTKMVDPTEPPPTPASTLYGLNDAQLKDLAANPQNQALNDTLKSVASEVGPTTPTATPEATNSSDSVGVMLTKMRENPAYRAQHPSWEDNYTSYLRDNLKLDPAKFDQYKAAAKTLGYTEIDQLTDFGRLRQYSESDLNRLRAYVDNHPPATDTGEVRGVVIPSGRGAPGGGNEGTGGTITVEQTVAPEVVQGAPDAAAQANDTLTMLNTPEMQKFISALGSSGETFSQDLMNMYMTPAQRAQLLDPHAQEKATRDLNQTSRIVARDMPRLVADLGDSPMSAEDLIRRSNEDVTTMGGAVSYREAALPTDARDQLRWNKTQQMVADNFLQQEDQNRMGWVEASTLQKQSYIESMLNYQTEALKAQGDRGKLLVDLIGTMQKNLQPFLDAAAGDPDKFTEAINNAGLNEFFTQYTKILAEITGVPETSTVILDMVKRGLLGVNWSKANDIHAPYETLYAQPSGVNGSSTNPEAQKFLDKNLSN